MPLIEKYGIVYGNTVVLSLYERKRKSNIQYNQYPLIRINLEQEKYGLWVYVSTYKTVYPDIKSNIFYDTLNNEIPLDIKSKSMIDICFENINVGQHSGNVDHLCNYSLTFKNCILNPHLSRYGIYLIDCIEREV